MRAADEHKILEGKQKEEETEEDLQSEEEESDVKSNSLWSRLSQMSVENEENVMRDSEEEQQGMLENPNIFDDKTNSSVDSQSRAVKCTEDVCSAVAKDSGNGLCTSQEEQLKHTDIECNILSSAVNKVPLPTKINSSCSQDVENEKRSKRQLQGLKHSDSDSDESQDSNNSAEAEGEFTGRLLTRDELLALFKMLHMNKRQRTVNKHNSQTVLTTVGLVSMCST